MDNDVEIFSKLPVSNSYSDEQIHSRTNRVTSEDDELVLKDKKIGTNDKQEAYTDIKHMHVGTSRNLPQPGMSVCKFYV